MTKRLLLHLFGVLTMLSTLSRCAVIKDLTTDRPKPSVEVPVNVPETPDTPDENPVRPVLPGYDRESSLRSELVQYAQQFKGIEYVSAGKKPETGFDCSGFTSYVMQEFQIPISSSARDQATLGREVRIDKAKPGDLVFYRRSPTEPIFHVSLVVENTGSQLWVVHSTSSRGIMVEDVLASSYWRPFIYMVRDVISKGW